MSIAISPITSAKIRPSTAEEAFEHALRVCEFEPTSWCAECLAESTTPNEFFSNAFSISVAGQIAVCMYFVSRAGFVVGVTDEP